MMATEAPWRNGAKGMVTWPCLMSIAALAGCQEGPPAGSVVEREVVDGVEHVTNAAADRPMGWVAQHVLTLGGADDGPEAFFRVTASTVSGDDDGNVYVLDAANHRVVAFDREGNHFLTVGGPGEGPGEFQMPIIVDVDGAGSIAVIDLMKQSLEQWTRDGTFTDSQRTPVSPVTGMMRRTDGGWVRHSLEFGQDRMRHSLLMEENGGRALELATHSAEGSVQTRFDSCGVTIPTTPIFSPELVWHSVGSQVVVNRQPEYALESWDGEVLTTRVERRMEPRTADRSAAVSELRLGQRVVVGGEECRIDPTEGADNRGWSDLIPLVRGIRISPTGDLWVERYEPGVQPGPIDVFADDGEYRGTLAEGFPWPLVFLPEDRIVAVESDSLEVQRLMIYEVRREE